MRVWPPLGPSLSLRKVAPYWWDYATFCKRRWIGRELLEVFTNEFRDRTKEYYLWAMHRGLCRVNGAPAGPRHVLRHTDRIVNKVHRHEPPVTAHPIRILYRNDQEGRLVVVKPGSLPVHPSGRYHFNTLLEMLRHQTGISRIFLSNRLDRLTSGVMVLSLTSAAANDVAQKFKQGKVQKFYVARVRGRFPAGKVVCNEPILSVDDQSGVRIVHSLGRSSQTIFERLSYHHETDTSLVRAQPITGRTHQIRVHVQFLGHPIANDPLYGHNLWSSVSPESLASEQLDFRLASQAGGSGSTGSRAVDQIVAAIKAQRDQDEDHSRRKDEVLFSQLLAEGNHDLPANFGLPGINAQSSIPDMSSIPYSATSLSHGHTLPQDQIEAREKILAQLGFNLSNMRFMEQVQHAHHVRGVCSECLTPHLPDPDPESLFIFLHAYKYTSDEWSYEDQFPWWARDDWDAQLDAWRRTRQQDQQRDVDTSVVFHVREEEQALPPLQRTVISLDESSNVPSSPPFPSSLSSSSLPVSPALPTSPSSPAYPSSSSSPSPPSSPSLASSSSFTSSASACASSASASISASTSGSTSAPTFSPSAPSSTKCEPTTLSSDALNLPSTSLPKERRTLQSASVPGWRKTFMDPLSAQGLTERDRQEIGGLAQLNLDPGHKRIVQHDLLSAVPSATASDSAPAQTLVPGTTSQCTSKSAFTPASTSLALSHGQANGYQEQGSGPLPPLMPCSTALLFDVFSGLEDVAEQDLRRIARQYAHRYGISPPDEDENTIAFLHSGHVAVPPGRGAELLLRAWVDGQIHSVAKAHLVLLEKGLPYDLSCQLSVQHMTDLQSSKGQARLVGAASGSQPERKKKKAGNRTKMVPTLMEIVGGFHVPSKPAIPSSLCPSSSPQCSETSISGVQRQATKVFPETLTEHTDERGEAKSPPLDDDLRDLPSLPSTLVSLIRQSWRSSDTFGRRDEVLQIWTRARVELCRSQRLAHAERQVTATTLTPQAGQKHGTSFKVAFHGGGYHLPSSMRRAPLNPLLAKSIWSWLNGSLEDGDERVTWPVNVRDAELVVHARLVPNWIACAGTGLMRGSGGPCGETPVERGKTPASFAWSAHDIEHLRRTASDLKDAAAQGPIPGAIMLTLELPSFHSVVDRSPLTCTGKATGTLLTPDRAYLIASMACLPPSPLIKVSAQAADSSGAKEQGPGAGASAHTGQGSEEQGFSRRREEDCFKVFEPFGGTVRDLIPTKLRSAAQAVGREDVCIYANDVDPADAVSMAAATGSLSHFALGKETAVLREPQEVADQGASERSAYQLGRSKSSSRDVPQGPPRSSEGISSQAQSSTMNKPLQADAVLAEVPWGQSIMTPARQRRFYHHLLPYLLAVLKPGGRAIILTTKPEYFDRFLTQFQQFQARKKMKLEPLSRSHLGMHGSTTTSDFLTQPGWTLEKTLFALPPANTQKPSSAQAMLQPETATKAGETPGDSTVSQDQAYCNPVTYQYRSPEKDDHLGVHAIGHERSPARAQGVRHAEHHSGHRLVNGGAVTGIFELRKVRLNPRV